METDDPLEALHLVSESQRLDPNCTDSQRLMVALLPIDLDNRIQLMRKVVDKAEQNFGKRFLEENQGHFWGVLSTRPYMRAPLELGRLLTAAERFEQAIAVYERMLELNPNDNQGVRYPLMGLYLATCQENGAARLFGRYPGEEDYTAVFAWGLVINHWLAGREADARSALSQARSVNRYMEPYLTGARQIPERLPSSYCPGSSSEADLAANELAPACGELPDFSAWLRRQP
jgi:tetratricopeptide (TPR) repeat protein